MNVGLETVKARRVRDPHENTRASNLEPKMRYRPQRGCVDSRRRVSVTHVTDNSPWASPSYSIFPVAGASLQMSDGNDDDLIGFDSVEKTKREAAHYPSPEISRYDWATFGKSKD